MSTIPFKLAGLAVAAVDGLEAVGVRGPYTRTADFQYGGVVDAGGRNWVVKQPLNTIAATMIEAEAAIAPALLDQLRAGRLPFDVMRPAGFAQVKSGRAVVYVRPLGEHKDFDEMTAGDAHELGRTLATIHKLPTDTVESAGLPSYDPQTSRRRLLADLHDADAMGALPGVLRRRWENALEQDHMWEFTPRVVHGDVADDQFMWSHGTISSVLGFGSAHVGDPAHDFAPLVSTLDEDLFAAVLESYENALGEETDDYFFNRTILISELALPAWMLFGARRGDDDIVADARAMMDDLAADVDADPDLAPGPTWSVSSAAATPSHTAADAGFTSFTEDGTIEDIPAEPESAAQAAPEDTAEPEATRPGDQQ
ncbi:phosphotransferase [Trueperella bialowiezensis]|uniref:Phosphotransferase enzyme family n=1 Tax=Trueperella bialowiezensis TaxID=312285 RepID=A0A448PGD2_9ACTO|nr:phosphotransferase [Trueperella bialowiezensis]VEI13953.1 Phosphotransferase enzyme family [Trueperella bialowiezensis]